MNFVIDENNGFEKVIDKLCKASNSSLRPLKKEFGEGNIELVKIDKDVFMITFDFELNQPIVIKWNYKEEKKSKYFLFYNLEDFLQKEDSTDVYTLEKGAVLFSQNVTRLKVWIPEKKYRVVGLSFSKEWFESSTRIFPLSEKATTYIENTESLYLNSRITPNAKLLLQRLSSVKSEEFKPFLKLNAFELIFNFFYDSFQKISYTKTNSTIHPDDLKLISDFANTLGSKLTNLPNISEASTELGVSESKFQRLFKKVFRETYYSYILRLRMDTAVQLLVSGKSVTEVSIEVGYSSVSNFTIAFKRYFNHLPSEVSSS